MGGTSDRSNPGKPLEVNEQKKNEKEKKRGIVQWSVNSIRRHRKMILMTPFSV